MAIVTGQAAGMKATLSELQRAGGLRAGQVVTTLVGLAISMGGLHAQGRLAGPLHPRHVEIDESGRPWPRPQHVPDGWQKSDDVVALLRLGATLAREQTALAEDIRRRAASGQVELFEVACWLLTLAIPEPIAG